MSARVDVRALIQDVRCLHDEVAAQASTRELGSDWSDLERKFRTAESAQELVSLKQAFTQLRGR